MKPEVIVLGLLIGTLVGMTGMGGASLMTPLLILVVGTAPVTAIGTDIFYGAITKTVGGWQHLKKYTVHLGLVVWLAVGSVPAALAGVKVIEVLQSNYGDDTVNKIALGMVGAALLVVGVATLIRSLFLRDVIPDRAAMHLYRKDKIIAVVTGAITGFIIGLTSAGSGTLIAIVLIAVFRLTPQRVVGTDIVHAAVLLWAAGIANWVGSNIDFALAGNILIGSIPGVLIGAHYSTKVPQNALRNILGVVLIGSALALLIKQKPPASVLIPSFAVAGAMIAGLLIFQVVLHRQHVAKAQPS
jgi:uncharacterized membrane protein YfcA